MVKFLDHCICSYEIEFYHTWDILDHPRAGRLQSQRNGKSLEALKDFVGCMGDSVGLMGVKKCFLHLLIEMFDWIEEHKDEIEEFFEGLGDLVKKDLKKKIDTG